MSETLRILSWNILHGAGSRLEAIADSVELHQPNVLILLEYRNNPGSEALRDRLAGTLGLEYQHAPDTSEMRNNTLLFASRFPFDHRPYPDEQYQPVRALEISMPWAGFNQPLTIIAGHFPQKKAQLPYLEAAIERTPHYRKSPVLMIGDLNTGIPFEDSESKTFYATHLFQKLLATGWTDLWRAQHPKAREFTWISVRSGNGFRYDHALGTSPLASRLKSVHYDHEPRQRGYSDHSMLLLELE